MRKRLIDRFLAKHPQIQLRSNFPNGGFISPHGAIVTAYGNHNAMVSCVKGTLRGLISSGVIRYHCNRDVIGVDLPEKKYFMDRVSLNTLLRVVKEYKPEIIVMSQIGRKYACTLGADGKHWTNSHIVQFASGGSVK